jgi:hypothetical protein
MYQFEIDDILVLRKQHPCGSSKWKVWKIGMDVGIQCLGCGRKVRISRIKFEKQVKINQTKKSEQKK